MRGRHQQFLGSFALVLLSFSVFDSGLRADPRHEDEATSGASSSLRATAGDALNKQVVDFALEKFHWDKEPFVARHGTLLPKALSGALSAKVDEIPAAAVVADLFGTVNDTQLQDAFAEALKKKKALEAKKAADRSGAENEMLAFLDRVLWAGRLTKLGLTGFEMLDDVKPEPAEKFKAFEEAFRKAFDRVLASARDFHDLVDKINAAKDPAEREKLQKQLAERFGSVTKFLDGQVASSEKDKTGEKVAQAVAQAIAKKNAEGHNLDLVGAGDTPIRIELGNDPSKFAENLRQARKEFAPLKKGGFGGTKVAEKPHTGGGVQTFKPGPVTPPPPPTLPLDEAVKKSMVDHGCLDCHGPGTGHEFFADDGQLKAGKSGKRLLQVLEGCGINGKGAMAKKAKKFREEASAEEKAALVAWAKKAGFGDLNLSEDGSTPEQCKRWETEGPPKPPTPPPAPPGEDKTYAFAEPPADLAEAKKRGIFKDAHLLKPEAVLAKIDPKNPNPPLVLNVNAMGKIKGSKDIGDLGDEDGKALKRLDEALKARKPGQELIVYCGCCKTDGCPFVMKALHELAKRGVRDARAIDFDDFETDWRDKGYPMEK